MFWKKGQTPSSTRHTIGSSRAPARDSDPPVEVLEPEPSSPTVDFSIVALETLAEVLRSMGRHAFDLDEVTKDDTSESFEKWALRLLVGEADRQKEESRTRSRGIKRDWGGVRRFVEKHRKHEHDYVVTGMENLRQAVRVFIQCTTSSLRAEHNSDVLVTTELDNLGRALAINDHAQIRDAAERTALTVRQELEARRSRERKQIDALHGSMEKLRHELSQARKQARTDGLTRVFNRAAFDEHILDVADQTFLGGTDSCVVMIDIDYFKGINDNYGHQAGDEVLRQVADTIVRGFFRREDFVARYGGEEFCVVCQHTSFDATRERAERLRQAVEKLAITAFGRTLHVSVSFGIALLQRGETAASWLQRADEALYRAKQKGRNCISIAPLGVGEALGGGGAPLGATLGVRPGELNPRIMVTNNRPSSTSPPPSSSAVREGVPPSSQSAQAGATRSRTERKGPRARSGAKTPANENCTTQSQRSGARSKRSGPRDVNSPIAALLGPSSTRRF